MTFSTQIQMISKIAYTNLVHNEIFRDETIFPHAIEIISFNFCETFFFSFSFESIIYGIRFGSMYTY